jgi:hypothetical protein
MVHSAKSAKRSKNKGQKRERDLANHYGAIRIGAGWRATSSPKPRGFIAPNEQVTQAETRGLTRMAEMSHPLMSALPPKADIGVHKSISAMGQ